MKIFFALSLLMLFSLTQMGFADFFVIFDENENFLEAGTGVDQGPAVAEIDTTTFYYPERGGRSIKIEAVGRGEKWADPIAAWEDGLKIVENPGEDEYRYMTFAWKGNCKTLAMDFPSGGDWGVSRYYAGAIAPFAEPIEQVDAAVPVDWTVYTVDVWENFGDLNISGWNFFVEDGTGWFDYIILHSDPEIPVEMRLAVYPTSKMTASWGEIKSCR